MKRIGDILTRNKTAVIVEDDTRYKQVTILPSANGAPHASPGQRPGNTAPQISRAESPASFRKHGL